MIVDEEGDLADWCCICEGGEVRKKSTVCVLQRAKDGNVKGLKDVRRVRKKK